MKARTTAVLLLLLAAGLSVSASATDAGTVDFFKQTCGICHGENGEGIPKLAPALKGNTFVTTADPKDIAATITKGRDGDKKQHKEFASAMPAHSIGGKKLQELIDYLRNDLQK